MPSPPYDDRHLNPMVRGVIKYNIRLNEMKRSAAIFEEQQDDVRNLLSNDNTFRCDIDATMLRIIELE